MRAYAVERGLFKENTKAHHSAAVYDEAFDRQVDYGMRRTLETTSGNILDSWLSGFIAQGVAGNLKVLVFCSSDKIRVDRIVNRDGLTVPEAKRHIFERETANVTKWRKMYSREWQQWVVGPKTLPADRPVWYWYPELYDLSIDTYKYSKEETLKLVLKKLGFPKRLNYSKIFA